MEDKKNYEPRVSTTDPEARIMKTSDGGYAPGYNMQVTTDAHLGLIAEVRVTQDVNDRYQLLPAGDGVAARLRRKPKQVVADGDFTTNLSVMQMAEREIDFYGSWNPGPAAKKRTEPDCVAFIRSFSGTRPVMMPRKTITSAPLENGWCSERRTNYRIVVRTDSIRPPVLIAALA